MVYGSSIEGGYGIGASVFQVDASHPDRIDISDAELLFRGHFARSGPDLVLTGQDGHRHIVPGYFATEKHPDLVAPNGAHLSGEVVGLLAGSPTPGQYAQAQTQAALPPEAIGKVEKVVGQVTLVHNGVSGPVHVGDAVYKSDVVETGANSSCGIGFPDGTALDLVAATRMALNDYSFDANGGGSNNALFTLVEGTFAFVAGQVAHTGSGMKIATPVATMGIRGTVGLFRSEPTVINSRLGHVWSVFLHEDLDGSHHLGRIALIDQDPTSPTFGQVFYLLDSSEYIAYLEPQGAGLPPQVRLEPVTNSKIFDDRHFYDDLNQILNSYLNGDVNPQSPPGGPGSSTPPDLLKLQQQIIQENGGKPLFNFVPSNGDPPPIAPPTFGGQPVFGGQNPTTHGSSTPPQFIFIWNGNGNWPVNLPNWNLGAAPNSPLDQVIIQSGTVNFDVSNTSVSFLTVDPGATLNITGGQLNAGGVLDNGTIIVDGDPPNLVITGPATIGSTGKIKVAGAGSEVDFNGSTTDNQGVIAARLGGIVDFNIEQVTNETGAKMVASGNGSQINFLGTGIGSPDIIDNSGLMAARHHGEILFRDAFVTNERGGEIKSTGRGSEIAFGDALGGADFTNLGKVVSKNGGTIAFENSSADNAKGAIIEAKRGGTVSFFNTGILNETNAMIEAVGCGALVAISGDALVTNPGQFLAAHGGTILFGGLSGGVEVDNQEKGVIVADRGTIGFEAVSFTNEPAGSDLPGGKVEATNWGTISFQGGSFTNGLGALVKADDHGSIFFGSFPESSLGVTNHGRFEATGCDSVIRLEGKDVGVTNDGGTFVAKDHGEIVFDAVSGITNEHGGKIEARDHGTILFEGAHHDHLNVINVGGVIAAVGCGSAVELVDTTITGGTIEALHHGIVELDDATIAGSVLRTGHHGLIETVSGEDGTTSTLDDVTIACDSHVEVGTDTKLVLTHGTTMFGGVLSVDIGGTLDIESHAGATLDGTTVFNHGTIQIDEPTHTTTLTLEHGADIHGGTLAIGNEGTLAIESGGATLDGVTVTVSGQGQIDIGEVSSGGGVDSFFETSFGPTLTLEDDTTITGGKLTIGDHDRLDIERGSGNEGATLDNVNVVNHGTIQVDKVLAATLKLDGGTTISGGDLSIGSWGKLEIGTDGSSGGATLDGVAVTNGNAIVIDDTTTSGAVIMLTLEHDTTITGGTLRIGEGSELAVENSKGAVLDGVTVTNDGNIEIDPAKATLIADDGTTITGGTMTIGGKGTFDVEAGEANGGGATLDNVDVANCGIVQVENGAILDLKGVTIAGGILNTVGEPYGDGGAIHVLGGDGKSIFDGSANTVTVEGYVQVEANAQLELKGDIDLAGGIIELDEAGHHNGSQLVIDGHVTLTGYGYIALEGSDTGIVGGGEGVATLDNESTIYGSRGGYIGDGGDSLIFINCGTVDSEAGHAGPLVIDTGAHAVINTGILEATGLSELDLYGTYENCGGTIGAYSDDVGPSVVKLFDATIKGGTLATDSSVPGGSMIEVVAGGTSVFDGSHGHAVTVDGYVRVDAGANLELIGTIHNDGMIDVDGQKTDLVIDGSVTLDGGGAITLDNATRPADQIVGVSDTEERNTLYNVDNTIEGAGNIGTGDENLSLVNERCGTIDANLSGQTLTLDTDNAITNWGILEATNGGKLLVQDCVNSCGPGHALIKDGTIEFDAAANINVTFDNGSGYGELILKDWSAFAGQISNFAGTQADAAHSDEVELLNFDAQKLKDSVSYNCDTGITTLTVWDAKNSALTDKLYFVGDYSAEDFAVKQVGNNVQIFDPPATSAPSAPSVSIGGAGNDTFVFQTGMGAETINNFNPQVDTIELDHFANAQNMQQLAALVTPDAHGDAAIEFGHNDSISIPGMTASYLQAHLQSLVHLH